MLDSRNSSGCGLEKEIVAFIYSDMESAERRAFESHLDGCDSCPAEIDAFLSVSVAIADWKANSFDRLETPAFTLMEKGAEKEHVITPQAEASIFGKVGQFFGFAPSMWQTATAFGAFLLAAGIIWVAFGNRLTEKEIAVVPPVVRETETTAPAPDIAAVDETLIVNENENERPAQKTISNEKPSLGTVKITPRKTPSRVISNAVTGNRVVRPKSTNQAPVNKTEPLPVVPRLTQLAEVDDTEDTGLRLADLFAGSDSEER